MIIRTITCHHAFNHGAMLQAYALVTYLQSLGHDAKVIDYRPWYMSPLSVDFKAVENERYGFPLIKLLYLLYKLPSRYFQQKRNYLMEEFFQRNICVTSDQYSSIDELRNNPPHADLYIAGSDQIWNTTFNNGKDPAFYLDFGHPKRKISYAASFATRNLERGTEEFVKNKLQNFDAISVREQSGTDVLMSLGLEGKKVVDPVFLLDYHHWDNLIEKKVVSGNYILTYDFEPGKSGIKEIAKRLASLMKCKVYSVTPSASFFNYADKSFMISSPDQFVSLIKHAHCVISNSFHGTAFSMIYGKNFFVMDRKDGLNARMQDLLNHYQLNHRLITPDATDNVLLANIDYESVYKQLSADIDSSKSFLQQQIELAQ